MARTNAGRLIGTVVLGADPNRPSNLPIHTAQSRTQFVTESPIVFQCPICRAPLTRPLMPLPAGRQICLEDGQQAVPKGFYAFSNDDYWTDSDGCPLVNLDDLCGTSHHPDASRHNGCCGRDGLDGPNLVCVMGHEIGTEKSDCWMAHAAVLLRDAIPAPSEI